MGDSHLPITNRSEAFKAIRKESLDIFNRLHSIDEDASFASSIAHAYPSFPVVGMSTMPYNIVMLIIRQMLLYQLINDVAFGTRM